jgi:MSHA pilin protein MshC
MVKLVVRSDPCEAPPVGKSPLPGAVLRRVGNIAVGAQSVGFTLVELIVTMIIIGILAVSVLPRFDSLGSFDAAGFADQTRSLLRYAQKSAIAQRRWVAVDLAASPPSLCSQTALPSCAANCAGGTNVMALPLPGGSPQPPRASTTLGGGSVFCFDALGRPIANGAAAPMAAAATLSIFDAGAVFRTIVIEPETGHVH